MLVKDTNPKDVVGVTKVPLSVIPIAPLLEVGVGMLEGSLKYGRHNFRESGVRASVYFDATWRHLAAWFEGQDIDPDSGMSHITKAICSLLVLRDSMMRGNWVDDRPPRIDPELFDLINEKVKELRTKYPDPVPPYTEVDCEF